MIKTQIMLTIITLLILAQGCLADLYQYTDNNGVIHFTDDPGKVPVKLRKQSKKDTDSPVTTKESSNNERQIKIDSTQNVSAGSLKKDKKNFNDLSDFNKGYIEDSKQQIDQRLSTPEGAYNLFKTALITGNKHDIRASVTDRFWNIWGEGFTQLNKQELFDMNKWVSKLSISKSELYEHYAIFELKEHTNGPVARTVELKKLFGNWKIDK